jgi:drug/metabolite transporter (DMT)-like permease
VPQAAADDLNAAVTEAPSASPSWRESDVAVVSGRFQLRRVLFADVSRRAWVLFVAMCLIWGIPYLLIRVAVRDVSPGTLAFMRTVIGGLVLLPLALRAGGFGPVLRRWKPLVAFAAIEIAIPWLLLGNAEQHLPSSLTGLLVAAVPLVGVLVGRLAGIGDHVDARRWSGLLLGLLGVGMLVGLDLGSVSTVAIGEVLLVAVGYATAPIIMTRYLSDLPSFPVISASLLLAAIAWAPFGLTHWPSHVAATGIASILVLGLVCTAFAFVLFFALISDIGPNRATVITYVNPAVAVALGLLFLNEQFTVGMGVGFPLILIGSVLAASMGGSRKAAPAVAGQPDDSLLRSR